MKKVNYLLLSTLLVMLFVVSGRAQDDLQTKLEQFGKDWSTGYLAPLENAFGAGMNSGWYNTANVDDGFSLFIGAKVMYMPIPDDAMKFTLLSPGDGTTMDEVPTLFGEKVDVPISGGGGATYPQGLGLSFAPFAVPHISIGNIYHSRIMIRFLPKVTLQDYGDVQFFGMGAQHGLNQYFPNPLPVDLAANFAFQNFKIGSLVDASAFSFGAQASKSFPVIDVYAGLTYETSKMSVSYTQTAGSTPIAFDLDGKNSFRFTAGINLNLFIFKINADYSLAKQSVATLGIGLGW